jgi:hypothetical protein
MDDYPEYLDFDEFDFLDLIEYDIEEEDDEYTGLIGALVLSDDSVDDDRFYDESFESDYPDYDLVEDINNDDGCSNEGDIDLNL